MDKDSQLFLRHLIDLANETAYHSYCTFSDFLNMNEQSLFFENKEMFLHVSYDLNGGYDDAERRMIKFYDNYCEATLYPIVCIKISAVSEKFSDRFTHRDFLGAVLNLGIDRSKTGDILIKNNIAYMIVYEEIAPFISENLTKVKHTNVNVCICQIPDTVGVPRFKTKQGTVTSIRIDSLVALAFNLSRTAAAKYISQGLVFINGRLVTSNSTVPKDNDIISVRTHGRFKLEVTDMRSKKEKYVVKIHVYS